MSPNEITNTDIEAALKRVASAAAAEVAAVAASAASQAAIAAASTAGRLAENTTLELKYIREDLSEIKQRLDSKYVTTDAFEACEKIVNDVKVMYVTKESFEPIRRLVYGWVALTLGAVVSGGLLLLFKY